MIAQENCTGTRQCPHACYALYRLFLTSKYIPWHLRKKNKYDHTITTLLLKIMRNNFCCAVYILTEQALAALAPEGSSRAHSGEAPRPALGQCAEAQQPRQACPRWHTSSCQSFVPPAHTSPATHGRPESSHLHCSKQLLQRQRLGTVLGTLDSRSCSQKTEW